jgi:hypothetical protein
VLYPWYGNASFDQSGLGSPGWNDTSCLNCPGNGYVVDTPIDNYYVSDSNSTFTSQLSQMEWAGLSYAILSWWGNGNGRENEAINKAVLDFFSYLKLTNSNFKAAIMVDAFQNAVNQTTAWFDSTYAYIYDTFVSPYSQWYFTFQGKPLILFFNPVNMSNFYQDSKFTVRTIGNRPNPVNWTWWDAPPEYYQGEGGNVDYTNDIGNPVISVDGEVTIIPRIDSFYCCQPSYLRFDVSLQPVNNVTLYQYEWNYVLGNISKVHLILIYSWNEYKERTAIEPHYDYASNVPPNYLLDMTRNYVERLFNL